MTHSSDESETIHIPENSDLVRLLDQRDTTPLRLEKDGVVYRVSREDSLWAGYDAERVREAVRATAGSWADLDTDTMIADLHHAREEGSRPADPP